MKKTTLTAILILLVISGSATLVRAQGYGPTFQIEYNTDRQGGDIQPGFPASFDDCLNSCAADAGCRAFTWVDINQQPPSYNNAEPLCWLKDSVPGQRSNAGMISGVKQ